VKLPLSWICESLVEQEVWLAHLSVQLLCRDTTFVLQMRKAAVGLRIGLRQLLLLVPQTVLNMLVVIAQRK